MGFVLLLVVVVIAVVGVVAMAKSLMGQESWLSELWQELNKGGSNGRKR